MNIMNLYLLQLMLSKGIGKVAIKKIVADVGSNHDHSYEDYCRNSALLQNVLYRPENVEETLDSIAFNETIAKELWNRLECNDIVMITESEDVYPEKLKSRLGKDCPPVLFLKGNIELLNSCCVGFCGSRKVSEKGSVITMQCAQQLVNHNITVVSGFARGTDIAAHRAAVESGGNTIFVLAEGILEYNTKNGIDYFLNDKNHLFISQFLPNAIWSASNAMQRNSVILGLSKAMILVESGKSGGTFSAGEESLMRNVPLYVIDYAKPEVSAEANPFFIERGGNPIRSRDGQPNLDLLISLPDKIGKTKFVEQLSLF